MRNYRLLLLDQNGGLLESKCIACVEDQEAIAAAKSEMRRCEYVEVWNGGRPLCVCARPVKHRVNLETLLRRWRCRFFRDVAT
jgi:hypothetical protein